MLRSAVLLVLIGALLLGVGIRIRYGGGALFEDRTGPPELAAEALEKVADLELPPGNIAVSAQGRIFFSFHPEASPAHKVVELRDGEVHPYPDAAMQRGDGSGPGFQSVLSLRIDRQGRLWILDYAEHGLGQPRLLAFDLASDRLVHRFDFARELAPIGSHLNDFQVSPDGATIYIADASIFGKRPALIVYDVSARRARRVLAQHPSVVPESYVPVVQGQRMMILGIFAIRPGVDSIALDRRGEWLYYAPVTSRQLYRIHTRDLGDESLSEAALGERVETFAAKTMSDGLSTDLDGGIYLTDPEHSAILRLGEDRVLHTLLKDPRLRWPDGLGFGPDGWLYITCSSLHQVILRSRAHVRAHAPYQIFRFRPGPQGIPGH